MKKLFLAAGILSLLLCWAIGGVVAQENKKLSIGDTAPALKYSKWIKGNPVTSLEGDQLYILEFWATWCGPCKQAMPHLTKLQETYKNKATFIGVAVWEKVPADKPYESSLPAVEKFVNGNAANMGYAVIADNNEQFMGNNWLKAAGEYGIPSTFIVKNNRIIWIGHPNALDSILVKISDASYDMTAYKKEFEQKSLSSSREMMAMKAILNPIQEAITAKDYQKALDLIEKVKTEHPKYRPMMQPTQFGILLNYVNQQKAIAFAGEWQKEHKAAASLVLGEIYNKDGLDKSTYLWAAQNYKKTNQTPNGNPLIFHALAVCYAKGGDYKNAVASEEKAVSEAKNALKNGKMIGTIMDYTVTEYEKALSDYKKMLH